jgi:yecA family protein
MTLSHSHLARTLAELELGLGASELHGSLTGFLCAGGVAPPERWFERLALEGFDELLAGRTERVLFERLYADCADQLQDEELGFTPLLPEDDAPLDERAAALVDWCRGFLGGLGLAGAGVGAGLSSESDEILGDFGRIAATEFAHGDAPDDDEDAYAEVVEYVRVGVLLLRAEIGAGDSGATRH